MTALADSGVLARRAPHSPIPWREVVAIAGASALTLLMFFPLVLSVWHGAFGDPDDAMRLVEVRAWMAGQSWFDVTAVRLDPPAGASMHWSRLVDVPNAALIHLFGTFTTPSQAEALDRIVLPTLFLVALYVAVARIATILLGRAARGAAVFGTLLCGATLVQFQPGRIGHHAPETVCLMLAVGAALTSLDPRRTREAALAGALVALAMAMSLETLPLLAGLGLVMVAVWVWRGAAQSRALAAFGIGLGFALPVAFLVTVAPDHWQTISVDSFGIAHLDAGILAAGGCLALALASDRLASFGARAAAAALLAAVLLGFVVIFAPTLLAGPFAGVDPLVKAVWLDHVIESKSLFAIVQERPMLAIAVAVPTILGLAACLVATVQSHGVTRLRFAALSGLVLIGLGVGVCQLRAFASVAPLALCGGVFVVTSLRTRLQTRGLTTTAILAPLAILPFASTFWIVALPSPAATIAPRTCLSPDALAPLATLPAGRAVTPLESGSHLIEATSLDVFAAPYHRNNDGNRFALDVWAAAPDKAQKLLADRGVTYVVTCPEAGDIDQMTTRAPDGLAASLTAGRVPDFLTDVPLSGTPYRVFRVTKP